MNIRNIKLYLTSKIGSPIIVLYFGSRNKKERYEGILWKTYNNVFVVMLPSGEIKSLSYIDILTKTIQIYI